MTGLCLLAVGWAAAVAWTVQAARDDLLDARDDLRSLRRGASTSQLLEPSTTAALAHIEERLRQGADRLGSPVLVPARYLPVVGRQVRSARALATAARDATSSASTALADVGEVLADAQRPETDRVALLRRVADVSAEAGRGLGAIDLGPDEALVEPLADARQELDGELRELTALLDDVHQASAGAAELLAGPGCHVLLAANNAEMRAGSGMFLQVGELCFADGRLELREMREASELVLAPDAVPITDPDLRDRWGHLLPNAEWRNLALTPRFDVTAELAARMWQEATGREVDGALAVDPVALAVLLGTTGPIEVDDVRYDAATVVDALLEEQYEDFMDPDHDADERQERLGRVAAAAVAAFDDGGWDVETLVDALPEAAAGRHILAWSRDPAVQEAFESMGVAGTLGPRSVAVSVLNRGGGRGGGKLDPRLEVEATLTAGDPVDGERPVTIEVVLRNTVRPGEPTYAEDPSAPDVRFGVYQGILAVNVPGVAGRLRIDAEELAARGDDGPTRVVAAPVELAAGERRSYRITFRTPSELTSLRIEPSARIPAIRWRIPGNESFSDGSPRTVAW